MKYIWRRGRVVQGVSVQLKVSVVVLAICGPVILNHHVLIFQKMMIVVPPTEENQYSTHLIFTCKQEEQMTKLSTTFYMYLIGVFLAG